MWRMGYTIMVNLPRLPKILETMHRMIDRPELYTEQQKYDHVRYITGLMKRTGHITVKAYGTEHLPKEGGYVLYPNHQGKFDAYGIVAAHDAPLSVTIDRERSYFMLVSEIVDVLRGKRLDINDARQGLRIMREIAAEVAEGQRFIIFPEGAYSDDKHHDLWDFRPGCFKAAMKAKVPIVPVALFNSYKVYNSWTFLPVTVQVHFLEPIDPEQYADRNTMEVSDIVKSRIAAKLEELGGK